MKILILLLLSVQFCSHNSTSSPLDADEQKIAENNSNNERGIHEFDSGIVDASEMDEMLREAEEHVVAKVESQGEKRALIIAISAYDKVNTGWGVINAKNDVPLMKSALLHQGFKEENIMISQDGTKQNIEDAFKAFEQSIPKNSGDAIVIHFSSHGQQITDQNGDEVDGLDEAIIPIDACVSPKYNNYDGSKHLRDDEIGEMLSAIRNKVGQDGSVFLIMDACHSGTSSRGMGTARGSHLVYGQPANTRGGGADESGSFDIVEATNLSGSLIAFYGASADNLNYETTDDAGKPVGSLTYGVSKALVDADENTSYEALFGMTRNYMARKSVRNIPQNEGNMNQVILGGALLPATNHYTVMQYKEDRKLAVINGGELHGIFAGASVAFYPPDTRDITTATPIVSGKVLIATEISARIALDDAIAEDKLNTSWVHVTEYALNYPDVTSLAFDVEDISLKNRVIELFGEQTVISFVDKTDSHDLIVEDVRAEPGNIQIYTKDDNIILKGSKSKCDAYAVHEALLDYVHSQHIRNLEVDDPRLSATLELIPITIEDDMMGGFSIEERLPLAARQDASQNLIFNPTDVYRIKVTNNSAGTIYFTILDITPKGIKQCLVPDFPEPGYEAAVTQAECRLDPGKSVELPNERISVGYQIQNDPGKETLKLIITSEPWNICETLQSRGAGSRGPGDLNPLDILLDNTFRLAGTRSKPLTAPRGGVAISSLSYSIEPQK